MANIQKMGLSSQDKKDLDKFIKHLVYKTVQVIVQSRLGERCRTLCKPIPSGTDWFNLAIKDLPEVYAETKKAFPGASLLVGQCLCVEISLRTAEGETMVLETWSVSMAEVSDTSARVSYVVYNRMGIMLKSLLCASRVTPGYALSRKQGPDTYVICYRIYMGEPQTNHLGQGHKSVKCGNVPTPIGSIQVAVTYRTKMLMSPHTSMRDMSMELKDNHFTPEHAGIKIITVTSPKKINSRPCQNAYRELRTPTSDEGETTEACSVQFSCSPLDHSPLQTAFTFPAGSSPTQVTSPGQKQPQSEGFFLHNGVEKHVSLSEGTKVGAFAPAYRDPPNKPREVDDIPFVALLQHSSDMDSSSGTKPSDGDSTDAHMDSADGGNQSTGSASSATKSMSSEKSAQDDFVMVELKTPFAGTDANSDLGKFYRDCQGAPSLSMFKEPATVEETLNSITEQLSLFEADAGDFDAFVKSLETLDN